MNPAATARRRQSQGKGLATWAARLVVLLATMAVPMPQATAAEEGGWQVQADEPRAFGQPSGTSTISSAVIPARRRTSFGCVMFSPGSPPTLGARVELGERPLEPGHGAISR